MGGRQAIHAALPSSSTASQTAGPGTGRPPPPGPTNRSPRNSTPPWPVPSGAAPFPPRSARSAGPLSSARRPPAEGPVRARHVAGLRRRPDRAGGRPAQDGGIAGLVRRGPPVAFLSRRGTLGVRVVGWRQRRGHRRGRRRRPRALRPRPLGQRRAAVLVGQSQRGNPSRHNEAADRLTVAETTRRGWRSGPRGPARPRRGRPGPHSAGHVAGADPFGCTGSAWPPARCGITS